MSRFNIKKLLLVLSSFMAIPSFGQKNQDVYYEIFVRSFYDSNGDGIGDINGITQKLDYLKDLGITGLWLTPVHASPSYHKYDVLDYRSIDAEYGTINDYKNLVEQAHLRGIKILLDFVVNHTSRFHPWFQAALNNHPFYKDFYVWQFDTIGRKEWYSNPKNPQEKYYAFFWEGMPDLNFDNPIVRDSIIEAGKFWITQIGVDGFRLDAAQHVYDAADVDKNNQWWQQFKQAMQAAKPNVFLLGEVWNKDSVVATYLKTSLDACFNFDLSNAITKTIKEADGAGLVTKLQSINALYQSYNPNYVDATFISNHDQDRYRSSFNGDLAKAKQAFAMLMTLPGVPFLYYGEEIGMLGKFPDEYRREPFLWGEDKGQTNWEIPRYSNTQTVTPLQTQLADKNAMVHFYKQLIALRKANPLLANGEMDETMLVPANKQLIAYELSDKDNTYLVLHYVGNTMQTIKLPKYRKLIFNQGCVMKNNELRLAPNSTWVVRLW